MDKTHKQNAETLQGIIREWFPNATVTLDGDLFRIDSGVVKGWPVGIKTKFDIPTTPLQFKDLYAVAQALRGNWMEMIESKSKA